MPFAFGHTGLRICMEIYPSFGKALFVECFTSSSADHAEYVAQMRPNIPLANKIKKNDCDIIYCVLHVSPNHI